jgi:signal transduction histidine kinase
MEPTVIANCHEAIDHGEVTVHNWRVSQLKRLEIPAHDECGAREELERLAREQRALRRKLVTAVIANAQAHADLRRLRAELTASRAQIAAAVDETRRRIERDLHDGAQQRLISLALRLRVVQASVPPGLGGLQAELGQVAAALTSTLDELREYARGIHPVILAERGLAPALSALARRSPVPVQLDARNTARLPEQVEATAYFVVSEALANAARHAKATVVRVTVGLAGGVVWVSVSDDGVGGAAPARGSGLAGLKDRVEAVGGTLIVRSRHGEGTRLDAALPVVSRTAADVGPSRSASFVRARSRRSPRRGLAVTRNRNGYT